MPTRSEILGFSNRWYAPAMAAAQHVRIDDLRLRLITPVYFVATKLDAFRSRGEDDFGGSHDLEDVIAVIDGRPEIVEEVAAAATGLRAHVAAELSHLLATRAFLDALPGFLLPDAANQARQPILLRRLSALASLGSADS